MWPSPRTAALVMARGYSHTDADARRAVTADTLFCIASVTKAITALGILRLVDEGKVKLDARLLDLASRRHPGRRQDCRLAVQGRHRPAGVVAHGRHPRPASGERGGRRG